MDSPTARRFLRNLIAAWPGGGGGKEFEGRREYRAFFREGVEDVQTGYWAYNW